MLPESQAAADYLGHLYQSMFKSFPIQSDEHFYVVCRYVERNPFRGHPDGATHKTRQWQPIGRDPSDNVISKLVNRYVNHRAKTPERNCDFSTFTPCSVDRQTAADWGLAIQSRRNRSRA